MVADLYQRSLLELRKPFLVGVTQTVLRVIPMVSTRIARHTLGYLYGQGIGNGEEELICKTKIAKVFPKFHLSTLPKRASEPWKKTYFITLETGLEFSFLASTFVFAYCFFVNVQQAFTSCWCTTRRKLRVIIGESVES